MSEMKIPQEPSPTDRTFIPPIRPGDTQIKDDKTLSKSKDSLEAFSKSNLNLTSAKEASEVPQLETPQAVHPSLLQYFKAINAATFAFRQQLRASDIVDQENRRRIAMGAASQAQTLAESYRKRAEAIAQLENQVKEILDELQKKLEEMQNETKEQQERIDQINGGNALEKEKFQELSQAYDDYVEKLKSIGAIDQGNGNYSIPEGKESEYNDFTREYQQTVDQFNNYWKERQTQINHYNSATIEYNQRVAENNQYVHDLINKYDLSDFLKNNGMTIPNQSVAGLRDLSSFENQVIAPSPILSTPTVVSTYPLPEYVRSIGNFGPPPLPSHPNYTPSLDRQTLYTHIYRNLYEVQVAPYDQRIQTNYAYWSFLHIRDLLIRRRPDLNPEPLLNIKALLLRVLPEALIESSRSIKQAHLGMGTAAIQALGVNNSDLEEILGRSLFKQALEESNLNILREKDDRLKDLQMDEIADRLLLLSVGLLGNQSLQALFPSFNAISSSLDLLPKDSPAFAILFATSFANRVQEDAKLGITAEALQTFLNENSDMSELTESDKAKLTAILNLGQLLVACKMLEANMGLQGLFAQLLPTLSPSFESTDLLPQAAKEGRQTLEELQIRLENHFIDEGFSKDKAQFLAHTGSQIMEQGPLSPTSTSLNSAHEFNRTLLIDSIVAALVLADYPLTQAHSIALEATEQTLAEGPYYSIGQFRKTLESHLKDLGIRDKSSEIALQAILIPPEEKKLAFLATPSEHAPPPLSPTELRAIIQKRSLQLLIPQLGTPLAKQLTEEIIHTFLGTSSTTSSNHEEKSPFSLVSAIKDQLDHLEIEHNQNWTETVSKSFKETIKTMENFYSFSLKLMDPAYLFVNVGIIYEDRGKKKSIDILI